MKWYRFSNMLIPRVSHKFVHTFFRKKIPIRIKFVPLQKKDITNYRESPVKFFPFTKEHPSVYDAPYMNQFPYYGIRTDIRWYDYINGPIIGTKPSELY